MLSGNLFCASFSIMPAVSNECIQNGSQSFPLSLSLFATAAASSLDNLFNFFTSHCVQFHCSILQLPFNRLYYTFIRQKKQHMTFSVILSVHHKYWLRLLCIYPFFYISDGIIPSLRHIQFDMIKRCCTFLCSAATIY